MRFLFSDPYNKMAGEELELPIPRSVPLRSLILRFPPDLIKVIHHNPSISDAELSAHVMFINKGRLLKLDEMVDPNETIKVMLPAWGG